MVVVGTGLSWLARSLACLVHHVQVDLRKVAMDAIKAWVASRITQLLGFEDEVLIGFAFGLLDDKVWPHHHHHHHTPALGSALI